MAGTLIPATATITISESVMQNGTNIGKSNAFTIPSVIYSDVRTMLIPSATEIDFLAFAPSAATLGAGKFQDDTVKYLRVTNKDDTNSLRFRLFVSGGNTVDLELPPGKFIVLTSLRYSVSETGAAFASYVFPEGAYAQATSAPIQIEYFIVVG